MTQTTTNQRQNKTGKKTTIASQLALSKSNLFCCMQLLFTTSPPQSPSSSLTSSSLSPSSSLSSTTTTAKSDSLKIESSVNVLEIPFDIEDASIFLREHEDNLKRLEIKIIEMVHAYSIGDIRAHIEMKAAEYRKSKLSKLFLYTTLWLLNAVAVLALAYMVTDLMRTELHLPDGESSYISEIKEVKTELPGSLFTDIILAIESTFVFFLDSKV
jgi:hypothetical protein